MSDFAVAACADTPEGRFWLEPRPCAGLEDGLIVIDYLKSQSDAWLVLAVMQKAAPGHPWATVHLWERYSTEERQKAYKRSRILH